MTQKRFLIPADLVKKAKDEVGPLNTIRTIDTLGTRINEYLLEQGSNLQVLPMHLGNPSPELTTPKEFLMYANEALYGNALSSYAPCYGFDDLNQIAGEFICKFVGTNESDTRIIQSVGGAHAAFLCMNALKESKKDTMIIFTPGFPVNMMQANKLGIRTIYFEFADCRGEGLKDCLETVLIKEKGRVHSILYSNPNNPTWFCLTEDELKTIAELSEKYGFLVMEDLAYFGMDFRKDYSHPGVEPFQPSVSKYTDNYLMLFSGSKFLSCPGARFGFIAMSKNLAEHEFAGCQIYKEIVFTGIAITVSSAPSLTQVAAARYLLDLIEGKVNFREPLQKEYEEKTRIIKELFLRYGFPILYNDDCGEPIADGFYFTSCYPGMSGREIADIFPYFGVTVTPTEMCYAKRQGFRVCTSFITREQIPMLDERLRLFTQSYDPTI